MQTDHLISARRPDLVSVSKKKKKKKRIVDLAVSADYRVKSKESEKRDKYLDLASEAKNVWNKIMTQIRIVNGARGTIPKGLVKRLEDFKIRGQVKIIQTTALLR